VVVATVSSPLHLRPNRARPAETWWERRPVQRVAAEAAARPCRWSGAAPVSSLTGPSREFTRDSSGDHPFLGQIPPFCSRPFLVDVEWRGGRDRQPPRRRPERV